MKKASAITLFLVFILYSHAFSAAPMPTPTLSPVPGWCSVLNFPVVRGWVNAITATSDSVYAGGNFSFVGPRTGAGSAINPASGAVIPGFPEIAGGSVYTAISDGSGGWYAGGNFSYAAGLTKSRLVHIYANGSLDPVFNPGPAGTATALLLYNGSLYVSFGTTSGLAKLDPVTGAVDAAFNAQIQSGYSVNIIMSEGANLVIAGSFTTIAGLARGCAARVNAATGALDASFDPQIQGAVLGAASDGSSYYFGGVISNAGSPPQARQNIVKVGAATGALDASFAPNVNVNVSTLCYDGINLYIGGGFTTINAAPRSYLAKLDPVTGAVDSSFAAVPDFIVYSISDAGTELLIGGAFLNVNATYCMYSARVNKSTGAVNASFAPGANNSVRCIIYDGVNAFIGGDFSSLGSILRPNLVKINAATGAVDAVFNANVNSIVYSLCLGNNSIYAGGMFSSAGGAARSKIAKLDANTGAADAAFIPGTFTEAGGNPKVNALSFDGTGLYVGGMFNAIGGVAKTHIAKLDGATAALDPAFNAAAVSAVYSLLYDGADVFMADWGSTPNLKKLDPSTGVADVSFNPGVTSQVVCLADDGANLFLGGGFNISGGAPRDHVAKISKATGQVDNSFVLSGITNAVNSLAFDGPGSGLFVAGMWNLGVLNQSYALRADSTYGYFDASFRPSIDSLCYSNALSPSNETLYLGGQFGMTSRFATTGLAALCLKNPPSQTLTPVYSPTFTPSMTRTFTPTRTVTLTITQTETAADTFTITETPTITETWTITETHTETPDVSPTPTITPTAQPDCVSFHIDRSAVPAMVFMKKLTLKINAGDCDYCTVYVDGVFVPSYYSPATKECMFTTTGDNIQILRNNYTGNATNAITKAMLYNGKKWAYSFTFDDGRPSDKNVDLPILDAYGYRAGVALNTQQMTASVDGYVMSWASADVLRAHGWSFFDHNFSHQNVTCANISTETVPVKNSIEARWPGYYCTHFVYPYCDTTYWTCIRDSGLFLSAENWNGNNYADVVPGNTFMLNRNTMMSAGNAGTTALANALADNAAADARPRWMIMFTHDVAPGSTAPGSIYDTNEATFGPHIAYVYNTYGAGGLDNMWFAPTDEVMQYILTRANSVVSFTGSGPCSGVTPATPSATHTVSPVYSPTVTRTATCTRTTTPTSTVTPDFSPTPTAMPYLWLEPVVVYPNPAKALVTVRFRDGMGAQQAGLSLYTMNFRMVKKQLIDSNALNLYTLDVSGFAKGVYAVEAKLIKDGAVVYRKVSPLVIIR